MKINRLYSASIILIVLLTPAIQWAFPWTVETSLTLNIYGYSLFYTEMFVILVILLGTLRRRIWYTQKVVLFLVLIGIGVSLLAGLYNFYENWFIDYLVSLDFLFYGLLLCSFTIENRQLKIIRSVLVIFFVYICVQQIFVTLGIVTFKTINRPTEMGVLLRYGTTIGSSISTGYYIFITSGILVCLYRDNVLVKNIVKFSAAVAILLTLSRGPVVSYFVVVIIDSKSSIKKIFKSFKATTMLSLFILGIIYINVNYNLFNVIEERFEQEDFTSGRDDRWGSTLEVYLKNSIIFGAGNNIVPLERAKSSGKTSVRNKACSPHNFYLSFLVEKGILGLLSILVLSGYLFWKIYKNKNIETYPKYILLMVFVTFANFEVILRDGIHSFTFWLLFFLLENSRKNARTI